MQVAQTAPNFRRPYVTPTGWRRQMKFHLIGRNLVWFTMTLPAIDLNTAGIFKGVHSQKRIGNGFTYGEQAMIAQH